MAQKNENSTVRILPETEKNTLCIEYTGLIKSKDHSQNLRQSLENIIKEHGLFNLLIVYGEEYQGWEFDAADISFKSMLDLGQKARKIAYVNPSEKRILLLKIFGHLFSGETRCFDKKDFRQAVEWVKS